MERKALKLELRDGADEGTFTAVFSTFNVIDRGNDVVLPGAFEQGAPVRIASWGHKWHELPVGRGVIVTDEKRAMLDGRFFIDTAHGQDTYLTVKGLGELQEWSYGFDVLEAEDGPFDGQQVRFLKKLKIHEVSPVMLGEGINTGTLDIKAQLKVWEETENEIRHQVRDPDDFQDDSFRHLTIKGDKPRVFAIIGRLKGETTTTIQSLRFPKVDGWTITSAKKWVSEHPDVTKGLSYEQEGEIAEVSLADISAFADRSRSLAGLRAKDGRVLSAANRERLTRLLEQLSDVARDIGKLLDETEPEKAAEVMQEFLRYQRTLAGLVRV